jgi:hypothetical protein
LHTLTHCFRAENGRAFEVVNRRLIFSELQPPLFIIPAIPGFPAGLGPLRGTDERLDFSFSCFRRSDRCSGDVSRYLPAFLWSDHSDGKDQILRKNHKHVPVDLVLSALVLLIVKWVVTITRP